MAIVTSLIVVNDDEEAVECPWPNCETRFRTVTDRRNEVRDVTPPRVQAANLQRTKFQSVRHARVGPPDAKWISYVEKYDRNENIGAVFTVHPGGGLICRSRLRSDHK